MRILHLLASPVWSGPAELVAQLALAQRALGHEVTVAVDRKRAGLGSEEPSRPRFEALDLFDDGGLELSVKSSPGAVLADVRKLKARALDVLHAHFSHDHLIARFGRPKGTTLIRSIHAPRSLRWSLPRANGFTVPSDALLTKLEGRPGMVLPALVDEVFVPARDRAAQRRTLKLDGAPLIGMVSTFQPSRRHQVALEAFAIVARHLPAAHLLLLGDGALEPQLREQVAALGMGAKVTFGGYHSGESFVRRLQTLDEVWVLGLGNDFSGRAAAQAKACGARVVAVDEGALPRYADAVIAQPTAQSVADACLGGDWRPATLRRSEDVAGEVLAFYAGCQEEAGDE